MKDTDQTPKDFASELAAEAARDIKECIRNPAHIGTRGENWMESIIKSAIEKATERLEDDKAKLLLCIKGLESRAAHSSPAEVRASEPWTVRRGEGMKRIVSLLVGARCLLRVGAKIKETDLQQIADAHNATLQPANASEPPQSRGERGAEQLRLQAAAELLTEAKQRLGDTAFPSLSSRIAKFVAALSQRPAKP